MLLLKNIKVIIKITIPKTAIGKIYSKDCVKLISFKSTPFTKVM
ncbi:hypothetical protein [Campylobacter hyointestinalis]|nr:hypothetical protein [Campylobacter hyointestinalis]